MHTYTESIAMRGGSMRTWAKLSGQATFWLGALSFLGMICRVIAYEYFRPRTVHYVSGGQYDEAFSVVIAVSLLVMFVFHIAGMLTSVYHSQLFGDRRSYRKASLAVGIISFMSIFVTIGCLSDIGKEAPMGWDVGIEWAIAYLAVLPQALFHWLIFVTVRTGLREAEETPSATTGARHETVFYAVHYTGLLCGAIGLGITSLKFTAHTSVANLRAITLFWDSFIIAPYLLVAAYWLFIKRRENIGEWYDEKQFSDIGRAGVLTLLAAIPFMTLVYAVDFANPGGRMSVLWFPFILHFVLVTFSGSTLYLKET